jgi:putative glutamine amidotransferase
VTGGAAGRDEIAAGPRIAVSGVVRGWEGAERTGVNAAYVRSVLRAGGVPVILSPLIGAARAAAALEGADGLLLTGGEDVDPGFYGEGPSALLGTVDRERDRFEMALFAAARQREIPVLGICRGIQLVNVALGGTLWQDLPSERQCLVDHEPRAPRERRTHRVDLAPGSRVARLLGTERLEVNSIHHQGIKALAPGLVASGWAEDGLIESVESAPDGGWLVAVQWHPEEMHADAAAPERGLFSALVDAASERALAHSPR